MIFYFYFYFLLCIDLHVHLRIVWHFGVWGLRVEIYFSFFTILSMKLKDKKCF